jgi:hypothetical protein
LVSTVLSWTHGEGGTVVPSLKRFPATVAVAEVVGALRDDGGVIVERLFPEPVIAAINR